MGVALIAKILEIFGLIFMRFWTMPMGDLGFNLGTFTVFILILKFVMSVFLSIDIQPASTRRGFSKIGKGGKAVGGKVAERYSKKKKKVKGD